MPSQTFLSEGDHVTQSPQAITSFSLGRLTPGTWQPSLRIAEHQISSWAAVDGGPPESVKDLKMPGWKLALKAIDWVASGETIP